jgi:Rrf2 family transcriptional regulator, iron-sulfur cluster assembly transcription factor
MVYSRASEYGICALVHIARRSAAKFITTAEIAEAENWPCRFLAKILQTLARKRILESCKGPDGGFALRLDPHRVCLLDIVCALEEVPSFQGCALGRQRCSTTQSCAMHKSWAELRSQIILYLKGISIASLAQKPDPRLQN